MFRAMKSLSLEDLRQQIETKYGPVLVDLGGGLSAKMMPVLRLPRERRELVQQALAQMDTGDNTDLNAAVDKLAAALRSVCETEESGDRLLNAVGDEGQLLQMLFQRYMEETGLGDPSPSDS